MKDKRRQGKIDAERENEDLKEWGVRKGRRDFAAFSSRFLDLEIQSSPL